VVNNAADKVLFAEEEPSPAVFHEPGHKYGVIPTFTHKSELED